MSQRTANVAMNWEASELSSFLNLAKLGNFLKKYQVSETYMSINYKNIILISKF
jgi:hypothetical protein